MIILLIWSIDYVTIMTSEIPLTSDKLVSQPYLQLPPCFFEHGNGKISPEDAVPLVYSSWHQPFYGEVKCDSDSALQTFIRRQ